MTCQPQNAKSNFLKFSKVFIHTFSKSLRLDSSFKNCFQETFPVNVMNIKENTQHALDPLTPSGTKRNIR